MGFVSARGGGSIAGFSNFRARSARDGAEGAVLENFEDISKILPNYCTQKTLKLHFKDISDGPIFVSGRSENLKFPPGRSKSLKRAAIELIMHKNTIKHENIGFRGVFRRRRRRKIFFRPFKH